MEQYEYDKIVRRRAMIRTPETISRMDEYIILEKACLDNTIEGRQDLIDNPERRYWQPGIWHHPDKTQFTHLLYKPFPRCTPDLDMALNAITYDCGNDIRQMIEGYKGAKVWIIVKFCYEPANPKENKKNPIETYVSSKSTRINPRKPTEGGDGAAYAEPLRELYERIKQANATYILEGSGWVLAGILEVLIKGAKYDPLAGRCYRELPKYVNEKKAIINIQNTDDRCFGYALLWFLDLQRDRKHSERALLETDEMVERNHLADLPYILPLRTSISTRTDFKLI